MFHGHFRRLEAVAGALLFFLVLNAQPVRAQNIGGLKTLSRVDTAHFSIYFPASLENQALRLSGFADSVLADLVALIGTNLPAKPIPVLLSNVEIDLNGYFSPYPSNRIVIYLAGASGSLASLGDELEEVFLHELVHALSLNIRGPFWSFLSALAGDIVAPAAWVAPDSLIEGTAVWAESRDGSRGRLNDPAALESVYVDLAAGKKRGLWSVSGLADFPGSGNLAYYYGGLFAAFVEESYGTGSVGKLWAEAAKGEPFSGFDGNLLGGGVVARALGRPASAVWDEFLTWLSAGAEKTPPASESRGKPEALELNTRKTGPFTAGGGFFYYYDGERKSVFSLELGKNRRKKLFDADYRLETMKVSEDGLSLLLDWARKGADGRTRALAYRYDLASGSLTLAGPRDELQAGEARANLRPGQTIRLQTTRPPDASGWSYGLAPLGSQLLPARVWKSGEVYLMDVESFTFRSIASEQGGPLLVLSAVPKGGVSRLAVLESQGEAWTLRVQKKAPLGGARDAVISDREVFYRSALGEGAYGIRSLKLDQDILAEDFSRIDGTWIPLETWRKKQGSTNLDPEPKAPTKSSAGFLFPEALTSTRYPWADGEAIGLAAVGMDLTNRLSWSARAGWDYVNGVPKEALSIGLDIGSQAFTLALSDEAAKSATTLQTARRSSAFLSHTADFDFVPEHFRLGLAETIWASGLDPDYSLAEFAAPSYFYQSLGGRLSLAWSTMNYQAFPPYDIQGFSAKAGADYEVVAGQTQGWSIFGSAIAATARPSLRFCLYGALSPDGSLAFLPSGRLLSLGSSDIGSAAAPPYPLYKEYLKVVSSSTWYLFTEASATLFNLELWDRLGPLRLPLLPSIGLRRIVFRGGLRAAAFESATAVFPSSAFARAEVDAALLAGIAAEAHIYLMGEASYAFASSLSGGGAFHFDFGLGASY
ncbi:MAG: hypothetical protein NT061_01435 [Spirochaetes bacterium]|nr:hypothetical protein [Spirochaetota bacterium]